MMNRREWLAVLAGAAGGTVAIGAMEYFATRNTMPVMAVPFATPLSWSLVHRKSTPRSHAR